MLSFPLLFKEAHAQADAWSRSGWRNLDQQGAVLWLLPATPAFIHVSWVVTCAHKPPQHSVSTLHFVPSSFSISLHAFVQGQPWQYWIIRCHCWTCQNGHLSACPAWMSALFCTRISCEVHWAFGFNIALFEATFGAIILKNAHRSYVIQHILQQMLANSSSTSERMAFRGRATMRRGLCLLQHSRGKTSLGWNMSPEVGSMLNTAWKWGDTIGS